MERCLVLIAKSLIKQIETNSSQAGGITLETFILSLPLNYGGMMLKKHRRPSLWENQGLKQAETIKIIRTKCLCLKITLFKSVVGGDR